MECFVIGVGDFVAFCEKVASLALRFRTGTCLRFLLTGVLKGDEREDEEELDGSEEGRLEPGELTVPGLSGPMVATESLVLAVILLRLLTGAP